MGNRKREFLTAEIRPGLDDDIKSKIVAITGRERAELIRNGVRVMLGIPTYKEREVRERHVPLPSVFLSNRSRSSNQ
jgi:hypothetical protein